jgi:F-type H+-transporting ATPase subunit b
MEISISSLIAQVINFGIMFFIFSKFAARPLSTQIEARRQLIEKIKKADELYKQKIDEAEQKAQDTITEAMRQKEKIITEWESLALKQQVEIINDANHKADKIVLEAKNTANILEQELEKNFIESVKNTSKTVIKKLLQKDIALQNDYLQEILQQSVK